VNTTEPALSDRITEAVSAAEARTSAELVVVLAPRAESYAGPAHRAGAVAALATLVVAFYSPWVLTEVGVLLEVSLVYALATWLARRSPSLLRRLTRSDRRRRAALRAAQAAFVEERVDGTRDRTGILLHLALLEQRLDLLPDAGVRASVGEAPFHALERDFEAGPGPPEERLLATIAALGELLEGPLPRAEDDEDELEDRPRIREEPE
jgi:putative membrane protein